MFSRIIIIIFAITFYYKQEFKTQISVIKLINYFDNQQIHFNIDKLFAN